MREGTMSCSGALAGVAWGQYSSRRHHPVVPAELRSDPSALEDMVVAADPDPYYALPRLYGAPAYSRAPRVVPESERPPNPDDLPIAAVQTEDERAVAAMLEATGTYRAGTSMLGRGNGHDGSFADDAVDSTTGMGRRFSLRSLTGRLGSRSR